MILAFVVLLAFNFLGDLIQSYLAVPVPGALIGMSLFTILLYFKPEFASSGIRKTSRLLTTYMGLFFVPAGVGVISEIQLLRSEWFPVTTGLLVSTLLSLVVSALIMQWVCGARIETEPGPQFGETE